MSKEDQVKIRLLESTITQLQDEATIQENRYNHQLDRTYYTAML